MASAILVLFLKPSPSGLQKFISHSFAIGVSHTVDGVGVGGRVGGP